MILEHPAQDATAYIRDNVRGDLGARAVALAIADHITNDGSADVGVRTLAGALGVHPNSVVQAVRRLEAAGHLVVERGERGKGSTYRYPQPRAYRARSARDTDTGEARALRARSVPDEQAESARETRTLRARNQDTPRAKRARSGVPAAADSARVTSEKSSSSTRADGFTSDTRVAAALHLCEPFIEAEVDRKAPTNRGGYRRVVRDRVRADLQLVEAQYSTPAEMAAAVCPPAEATTIPAVTAAMNGAAFGGVATPARPSQHPAIVAERERSIERDEYVPIGSDRAKAAMAEGLEQERRRKYCPECGAQRDTIGHFANCSGQA